MTAANPEEIIRNRKVTKEVAINSVASSLSGKKQFVFGYCSRRTALNILCGGEEFKMLLAISRWSVQYQSLGERKEAGGTGSRE